MADLHRKFFRSMLLLCVCFISGCVTQTFENDSDTPIVENGANNNEIAMTRISLGLGYLKMGNTTQAKLNLEKAKRFAPKLVQVYTAFAHYYDTVGEAELAIKSYEQALSIDDEDPDTLNNYGVFLCRQEKYQAAEEKILRAIAVPSYLLVAQSYENLALCQLKADKFEKAEQYLAKSIQHNPSSSSALLQMVRLQYALGNYQQAEQYLQRYEKATRRFSAYGLALAYKVFDQQKNKRVAKNYASMLVKMFPTSYEAKQYILNELAQIEADELAKNYQLSIAKVEEKPKKRVLRLSPHNKKAIMPPEKTAEVNNNKPEHVEQSLDKNLEPKNDNQVEKLTTKRQTHKVEKGDSLFSISAKYNVFMTALERWNNINRNEVLRLGRVIFIEAAKQQSSGNE